MAEQPLIRDLSWYNLKGGVDSFGALSAGLSAAAVKAQINTRYQQMENQLQLYALREKAMEIQMNEQRARDARFYAGLDQRASDAEASRDIAWERVGLLGDKEKNRQDEKQRQREARQGLYSIPGILRSQGIKEGDQNYEEEYQKLAQDYVGDLGWSAWNQITKQDLAKHKAAASERLASFNRRKKAFENRVADDIWGMKYYSTEPITDPGHFQKKVEPGKFVNVGGVQRKEKYRLIPTKDAQGRDYKKPVSIHTLNRMRDELNALNAEEQNLPKISKSEDSPYLYPGQSKPHAIELPDDPSQWTQDQPYILEGKEWRFDGNQLIPWE